MKEFPSLKDVSEILESLNKLFEDRNNLLNLMFREDKYKDFLLAESVQSLAELTLGMTVRMVGSRLILLVDLRY